MSPDRKMNITEHISEVDNWLAAEVEKSHAVMQGLLNRGLEINASIVEDRIKKIAKLRLELFDIARAA